MRVKEFRLPLPFSVKEFKLAVELCDKKKLDEQMQSGNLGVLKHNEKYTYVTDTGSNGIYTKKIYYPTERLDGQTTTTDSKNCYSSEEIWDEFPYIKASYIIDAKTIHLVYDVFTHYLSDYGQSESIFEYITDVPSNCEFEFLDICDEKTNLKSDVAKILSFSPKKTNIVPLKTGWIDDIRNNKSAHKNVMCKYVLLKGHSEPLETQEIIESGLFQKMRHSLLVTHSHLWLTQDDWYGNTLKETSISSEEMQNQAKI